jgi:hypothetical protein
VSPGLQNLLASEGRNFEEASMDLRLQAALGALTFIGVGTFALAQDDNRNPARVNSMQTPSPTRTGKERLGPKWTDEQRIDNCHVPVEKRGFKPRPSACPNDHSS